MSEPMELGHLVLLALLQGLTEFLPISSSAHLILLPSLLGWTDQGLAFDVAVHVGTLVAVVTHFRRELVRLVTDWGRSVARREPVGESTLAWGIAIGTVPVLAGALVFRDPIETYLRSPLVIALATVGFGLLLLWADRAGRRGRVEHTLAWRECLLIGLAQTLALIPGTSRSGVTITAGLALGLTAGAAARFSFLLSIPVILAAGLAAGYELVRDDAVIHWPVIGLAVVLSWASAYACIEIFLRLVERVGLMPFIVYRLALGVALLAMYT